MTRLFYKHKQTQTGDHARRSVSGYLVLLGNSLVSWKSNKQPIVSKFSSEAEYRAMANATSEITWVVRLLKDLGVDKLEPVTLHCNSQSAIYIAKNLSFMIGLNT